MKPGRIAAWAITAVAVPGPGHGRGRGEQGDPYFDRPIVWG